MKVFRFPGVERRQPDTFVRSDLSRRGDFNRRIPLVARFVCLAPD